VSSIATPAPKTFATLAEKGRKVLRFGYYDEKVAEALRFLEHDIANAVARALPANGIDILPILGKARRASAQCRWHADLSFAAARLARGRTQLACRPPAAFYGAPTGFRLAVSHPERITAIISQNGNAYEEGLSDGWTEAA